VTQSYQFHVNIFAVPREAGFHCTWEDVATPLEQLSGMIFEPDGSFILSGNDDLKRRWHVNGHLFDYAGRLHRVELRGDCPPHAFDSLLQCVGWPAQPLAFELVREGVTVDEPRFRTLASK
jgi:hypothetical protein